MKTHFISFLLLLPFVFINVINANSGFCIDKNCTKCIPGVYGPNCTLNCPDVCQGVCHRSCNKVTGDCDHCANKQKWGTKCQYDCSQNCQIVGDGECGSYLVCNTTTGHCYKCAPDKWGTTCQHTCNCSNLGCDDRTGKCIPESQNKKVLPIGLIVAAAVVGFILILIIAGCMGMCCPGYGCSLQPVDFSFGRYSRPVQVSHGAGRYTTTTAYGTYGGMTSVATGNGSTTLVNNHQIQNL